MNMIKDAKAYVESCRDHCDGHAAALISACEIAIAANNYFDLSITARQPGEPSDGDRRTAVWKAVAKARAEGVV